MLLVEENHAGVSKSTHTNIKMLYVEEDRPRGGGGRGWSACNRGVRKEQDRRHNRNADGSSEPSGFRESRGGTRNRQGKPLTECWYYGKQGHRERECWKNHADSDKSGSSKVEHRNRQRSHYAEGSEGAGNGSGPTFVMK